MCVCAEKSNTLYEERASSDGPDSDSLGPNQVYVWGVSHFIRQQGHTSRKLLGSPRNREQASQDWELALWERGRDEGMSLENRELPPPLIGQAA